MMRRVRPGPAHRVPELLLMLGGLLVTLYILAPFSWLVLTSFMHEQDALSVPPQWIPDQPDAFEIT